MKTTFIFVLACVLVISCSNNQPTEDRINDTHVTLSTFNLEKDLDSLSLRMSEMDTIIINADLSLCMAHWHETNILTKKGHDVFIETSIYDNYSDSLDKEIGTTKYKYIQDDSSNFEDLFFHLKEKGTLESEFNSPTFTIIHKLDTICFYSESMAEITENTNYYVKIKSRLYPNAKIYQPNLIPIMPEQLTE